MRSPKLSIVPIRFTNAEVKILYKNIDHDSPVSPQLKKLILKMFEKSEDASESRNMGAANLKLEATIRDRMDQMVALMKMMVVRIEELEKSQQTIAADAARSKLVIENVQDHVADFLNSLPAR